MCFALIAGLGQYSTNTENLKYSGKLLRLWANSRPLPSNDQFETAVHKIRHRSLLYESLLQRDHLLDGMVVSRTTSGQPLHECDSLLFSSLRYVALRKLGFQVEAGRAWRSLEVSQAEGHWRRHPRCWEQSTSRDMLIGLMAALTQSPPGTKPHLRAIFQQVEKNNGFISDGPVYVSYLTPSIARLMRRLARAQGVPYAEMPDIVRRGYSTNEWAVPVLTSGYRTHLAGLAIWIDLEVEKMTGRSLPAHDRLNIEWISHKLVSADPQNLFFRYLRLRATNALNPAMRLQLLTDLAAMKAFPVDRLPGNCDRKADYLWQRDSMEYKPRTKVCQYQFPGVDFLWMAALLLETGVSHHR